GPCFPDGLQLFTHRDRSILRPRKGVVIEENLFEIWKHLPRALELGRYVLGTASAPRVPADCLRPQTERAKRRTASRGVERNEWVEQERNVVLSDIQIALVNVGRERQRIQIVKRRAIGVMHDAVVLLEAHSLNVL